MEPDRTALQETIGIVFLHHRTDEITANNLQSFREWNPAATIVTVGAGERLPGGYSIRDFPKHADLWDRHTRQTGLGTRSADLLVYSWYENRREHCDRWLIVEWDAFCAMTVDEFFVPNIYLSY